LVASFDVRSPVEARRFLEKLYHRPPWFLALLAREFPANLGKPAVREFLASATQDHSPSHEELGSLAMPILFLWGRTEKLLAACAFVYFQKPLPAHTI